ncbi:MAG: DUF305 domain-containing protein [Terriglobales bacterium]
MKSPWRLAILGMAFSSIVMFAPPQSLTLHGDQEAIADDPAWSDFQQSMEKMHVAMASVKPSHDADFDFVRLMIPHHQAAIDMAKTQLLYGKDPQLRRLAQEIITDQQSEVELMQLWLKQHAPNPQK